MIGTSKHAVDAATLKGYLKINDIFEAIYSNAVLVPVSVDEVALV